ncbi:MAG: dihydropteroate synthase [Cytophagales bacterium CG12_big_fil_rev_8_21_14_0_65_40_12]|nr:MAG: dihydropteroate synthase [Cytophagales bacterium CG12_big_fil_rev_8_21_14_0_65_40_12]PIW06246.1 MAG: dihydropteroate synthase [Cytophagales bacterium CG17_big_fil_post_rev_8_21_14_2_50_40_13]
MGIVNVTPDSFYAASRQSRESEVIIAARKMLEEGALILDIGGYSSRPGAVDISIAEERQRVTKAIAAVIREFPNAFISIDTFRSEVAKAAIESGACMVNDISGGSLDNEMFDTVAQLKVPYVLMHMRGTPQNMVQLTAYDSLLKDIALFFAEKVSQLKAKGVNDIILDPGFGFAKTVAQGYEILQNLDYFKTLQLPLLVGLSRKSMIYRTLGITPEESLNGTTAANMAALINGASILRVHDVKEARETIQLFKSIYP